MAVIQMDESYLLGGWFASALWGGYTVLFGTSLYLILAHKRHELKRVTTLIMCIMYALATVHVFIALRRIVVALIFLQNKPPGPIPYLANIGDPLNRAKDLIYITNLILGDSIITWRCYAVWGGNIWVVSLPIIMIIGTAIGGYGAIHQYFLAHPSLKTSVAWGTAMFSISLATNIIVTALTAGRIWYITRPRAFSLPGSNSGGPSYTSPSSTVTSPSRRYRTIVLLIIESGAVIAAAKIVEFTLFKMAPLATFGNHTLYIVFDMMPQITGIMPTLIILAVNAGFTSTSTYISDPPTRPARPSASLPLHGQAHGQVLALGTHLSFRSGGGNGLDTFGTTTRGSELDVDLKALKRQSTQSAEGRKKPELSDLSTMESGFAPGLEPKDIDDT